jgi:hypothetical protein
VSGLIEPADRRSGRQSQYKLTAKGSFAAAVLNPHSPDETGI